jgi:hypothetical protein
MAEKMKGAFAVLVEKDKDGREIGHHVVFRPYCEVYLPKLRDSLAEIEIADFQRLQDLIGVDAANRILPGIDAGQVIEGEMPVDEEEQIRSCPAKDDKFVKVTYIGSRGSKEDLVRESIAKKLGYTYCAQVK